MLWLAFTRSSVYLIQYLVDKSQTVIEIGRAHV